MKPARSALAALVLAAACSTAKLPPPLEEAPAGGAAGEFPAQVRFERPGMTCRASTSAAKHALKRMGYLIDSIRTPQPGKIGEIRGSRNTGWYTGDAGDSYQVAVRLTCDDNGSVIEAATEGGLSERLDFRRDFPTELDRAATRAHARRSRQPEAALHHSESKLQVFLQPLRGSDAVGVLGGTPEDLGVMPVRIQIRNRSEFEYRLEADRFKLISEQGARNRPMPIDRVVAQVAPEWQGAVRQRQIPDTTITPGQTVDGYVFVPTAAYRRAKVILIEAASGEAEGFTVEF